MRIQGKYSSAKIFTEDIDNDSLRQLYNLLNNPATEGEKIVIMPDVHIGKGCVVGMTMTASTYIIPSIIGVDIGCGVSAYNLGNIDIDLEEFDFFIRENIPSGKNVHASEKSKYFQPDSGLLKLIEKVCPDAYSRVFCSVGTLGGGNHFLELEEDQFKNIWLVIHSGSRNLGLKVCHYHQTKAKEFIKSKFSGAGAYYGMEYMPIADEGREYLHDMEITQEYALLNREVMSRIIIEEFFSLKFSTCEHISSIHNYFDFKNKIVRKGAISAQEGEKVIIPLNMRDGSLVGTGKGNHDWNQSAPHGAGRIFSRGECKDKINIDDYIKSMKGIFSSCISTSTIDESPMAYKSSEFIKETIVSTVDIDFTMKPIYNFKATDMP